MKVRCDLRLSPRRNSEDLSCKTPVSPLKTVSVQAAAQETALSAPVLPRVKDHERLARLVVREGKAFNISALECGYSQSIADKGLAYLVAHSSVVATAVKRETAMAVVTLDKLKPLAVKRLYEEIVNPKSANGMKAIELAGRFKETDWFVRNSEISLGVFMALGEHSPDATAQTIESYDKP